MCGETLVSLDLKATGSLEREGLDLCIVTMFQTSGCIRVL